MIHFVHSHQPLGPDTQQLKCEIKVNYGVALRLTKSDLAQSYAMYLLM